MKGRRRIKGIATKSALTWTMLATVAFSCSDDKNATDSATGGVNGGSGGADAKTQFVPDSQAQDVATTATDVAVVTDAGPADSLADSQLGGDVSSADVASTTADSAQADAGQPPVDAASSDAPAVDAGNATGAPDAGAPTDITQVGPIGSNGCADGTREAFLDEKAFPKIAACGGSWDVKGIHHGTPKCDRKAGNDGKNKAGKGCNVEDLCAPGWRVCYGKKDVLDRNPDGCARIMDGVTAPGFFLARTSSTGAFNCSQDSTKFGDPGTVNDLFGCGNLGCGTAQGSCTGDKKGCDPTTDCSNCAAGEKCADKTTCKPSVCFPLNRASHDLCKSIKKMPNCKCSFTDPAKKTVKCSPSSGGCGWCRPVNYYEKLNNTTYPAAWDCGKDGNKEALNVIKTDAALGGVLCCQI